MGLFYRLLINPKFYLLNAWRKTCLVIFSLGLSLCFGLAVALHHATVAAGQEENSGENSKRIRTDFRAWLKKTFPESAARANAKFGLFEYPGEVTCSPQRSWVFLLHGLDEPGDLWANLAPVLADEGFRVFEFRYPNDQPIHESSLLFKNQLHRIFSQELKPVSIHFIGHSMGGLVLREFITHPDLLETAEWKKQIAIRTLIQLGTPNHGSRLSTYRFPAEWRDHLFKNHGRDAWLAMFWDGAGEAQVELKPGSSFLKDLNSRKFPKDIYWAGIAGTDSPVDFSNGNRDGDSSAISWFKPLNELKESLPEIFDGTGDGCVSTESLLCSEMDAVYYVKANHRKMVRSNGDETPPAIAIVVDLLSVVSQK